MGWGASLVFWLQGKFGGLNQPFFGGVVVCLHTRILRGGWWVEGGLFSLWAALEEILSIGLPRCFIWVCRWIGIHLGHVFLGINELIQLEYTFVVGPRSLRRAREVGFSTNFKLSKDSRGTLALLLTCPGVSSQGD